MIWLRVLDWGKSSRSMPLDEASHGRFVISRGSAITLRNLDTQIPHHDCRNESNCQIPVCIERSRAVESFIVSGGLVPSQA